MSKNKEATSGIDSIIAASNKNNISLPQKRINTIGDLSSNTKYVAVKVQKTNKGHKLKFRIEIPESKLTNENRFEIKAMIFNNDNILVFNKMKIINHYLKKSKINDVVEPPRLSISTTYNGSIAIGIKQKDKNATTVEIYKKIITKDTFKLGGNFTHIHTAKLDSESPEIILYDTTPSMGERAMYRAIASTPEQRQGKYSEIVLNSTKSLGLSQDLSKTLFCGNISALSSEKGVILSLKYVIGSSETLYFVKRNISRKEKDFTTVISSTQSDPASMKISETLDEDVFDGETYEYRCKMLDKLGKEILSDFSEIITYQIPEKGFIISVSQPEYGSTKGSGSYSVRFNMSMSYPDTDTKLIYTLLENYGLSDLYKDDLESIKDNISNLFMFSVLRKSTKTGKSANFGLFPSGKFIDAGSPQRGILPPVVGNRYEYFIESYSRDPREILEEIISEAETQDRQKSGLLGNTRSKKNLKNRLNYKSKFINPSTLKNSTISTGVALAKNHAGSLFERGASGVNAIVDVFLPDKSTKITKGAIGRTPSGNVKITWGYSGNQDDIDHFVVIAERGKVRYPVMLCHNKSRSGRLSVIDDTQSDYLGSVRYHIKIVNSDYTDRPLVYIGHIVIQ